MLLLTFMNVKWKYWYNTKLHILRFLKMNTYWSFWRKNKVFLARYPSVYPFVCLRNKTLNLNFRHIENYCHKSDHWKRQLKSVNHKRIILTAFIKKILLKNRLKVTIYSKHFYMTSRFWIYGIFFYVFSEVSVL